MNEDMATRVATRAADKHRAQINAALNDLNANLTRSRKACRYDEDYRHGDTRTSFMPEAQAALDACVARIELSCALWSHD